MILCTFSNLLIHSFKFTIYKRNIEEPKILFPGHEQAKAKTKNNNVTKKGKPTKRAVR